MTGPLLTVRDAAACLGVHRSTLYRWITAGHLHPTPDGHIDQTEAEHVFETRRAASAATQWTTTHQPQRPPLDT